MDTPRRILVQCRAAPYGSSRVRDAVEMALACAAFDQPVTLLLLGDGVLALLPEQQPDSGFARNLAGLLGTLPDYGIATVHADAAALDARGLATATLVLPVTPVAGDALAALYAAHDTVLTV